MCSGKSTIISLINWHFGEYCSNKEPARILLLDSANCRLLLKKPCHVILQEYENPHLADVETRLKWEVIPFLSHFGYQRDSVRPNPNLDNELAQFAMPFLWLLVQHYALFKRDGLHKPQCVVECTMKYWES